MEDLTLRQLAGLTTQQKLDLAGRFAGVDGSVMDGIWRTESSRGRNMLSPAGARGHFGLMPDTYTTWSQRLGFTIDPDNFDHALIASAYTMRENLQRWGTLPDALRAYNSGWDRTRWNNPETQAYVGRVMSRGGSAEDGAPLSPRAQSPVADVSSLSAADVLGGRIARAEGSSTEPLSTASLDASRVLATPPGEFGNFRPAPAERAPRQSASARFISQFGGFRPFSDPNATSNVGMLEVGAQSSGQVAQAVRDNQYSVVDQFGAAVVQNTITGQLTLSVIDAMDQNIAQRDPDFKYTDHMDELEEGRTWNERRELRERATSLEGARQIIERQDRDREIASVAGDSIAVNLLAGLVDPVGYALGAGLGTTMELGGVGARTAFAAGNRASGVGLAATEGAVGNLIGTAVIDQVAGNYQSPEDYATSGLFGALIGTAASPFTSRAAVRERNDAAAAFELQAAQREYDAELAGQAAARAGPNATPEQIQAQAEIIRGERVSGTLDDTLNPAGTNNQLFTVVEAPAEGAPAVRRPVRPELDALDDPAARALINNLIDNAEDIVAREGVGEGLAPGGRPGILSRVGLASTGETLLRQNDTVAQAVSMTLLEGTTGRGGRRHSAALTQAITERAFLRPVLEYEGLFHLYREANNVGWLRDAVGDGSLRRQFDIEVATELRRRGDTKRVPSTASAPVRQAADIMAEGYRLMGSEQKRFGVLGSENIRDNDPSYFPQRASVAKLQKLGTREKAVFRAIISEQVRTMFGWDKEFSDYFGRRYLKSAMDKASGNYDVPMNLTHSSAYGYVEDLLESMRANASKEDLIRLDKAGAAFARGGPSYTKGRTNFDVMQEYVVRQDGTVTANRNARGPKVKLLDIMDTDMMGMYRSYARRASGEIALQQYGIAGRHGLKTIRQYLSLAHDAGRIDNDGLLAFDQISAEFLNMPFGKHNGTAMDNLRIATSVVKLGGMGITQFGEYGNGIAALGVGRVLRSIGDIPRLMGEIRTIKKGGKVDGLLSSIERQQGFEQGMDSWIMTRALDVKDNDIQMYGQEGMGLGTRVIRSAAHAQALLSMHRIVNAVQVRGMSEQILQKMMRFIRDGKEDVALNDMGLSKELRFAINESLPKMAEFDNAGNLTKLDIFSGDLTPAQRAELVGIIHRGASQIIQNTYIGETGKWAHDGFLKILFQFRTFPLTAVEKQWGRNVRNYGALKATGLLMGAMAFAAPIHLARVHARMLGMNEEDAKAYAEKYLTIPAMVQATMSYASAAGFAGDIWDIGGSTVTNIMGDAAPEWVQGTVNPRGGARSQGKFIGGVVAPSADVAEDLFSLANGDLAKLKTLLPGANLPYVVPLLNAMENAASDE